MPRNYVKTGRPPGRPRKDRQLGDKPPEQAKTKIDKLLDKIAKETGLVLHHSAAIALPKVDLTGITDPEALMKAALSQMMAGLHTQLPIALERISIRRPDIVISFYRDMAEYLLPKLSRLEQSGTVNHKHQHFVAVEDREVDPRLPPPAPIDLVKAEDGSFAVPVHEPA